MKKAKKISGADLGMAMEADIRLSAREKKTDLPPGHPALIQAQQIQQDIIQPQGEDVEPIKKIERKPVKKITGRNRQKIVEKRENEQKEQEEYKKIAKKMDGCFDDISKYVQQFSSELGVLAGDMKNNPGAIVRLSRIQRMAIAFYRNIQETKTNIYRSIES